MQNRLSVLFILLCTMALAACAAKTAADLPPSQRTPEAIYGQICHGCHGQDGMNKAYGVSLSIATLSPAAIEMALEGYKAGERDGMFSGTMEKQVAPLASEEIEGLAAYIPTLEPSE